MTDEWQMYADMNIPQDWLLQIDGKTARVDHYWNKVLQSKSAVGSPQFNILAKTVKCALSLSHANSDNEQSLSQNKKTLTKERTGLSITILNGSRATEDGIRSTGRLSNVIIIKSMLFSVKGLYKAYKEHIDTEKKEAKRKVNLLTAKEEESKKRQEKDAKQLEELKNSTKDLDTREAMLESACGFLAEGNKRITKGVAEKDMDEIEAAQKIIEFAEEKQKAQEELQIVHKEKRKITEKLREKAFKKLKTE